MKHRSLLANLLLWLLIPLAVAAALGAFLARGEAARTATVAQDRLLLGSARIIAQQIQFEDGVLDVMIPPAALELFRSDGQDQVFYRITSPKGVLLSGYAELRQPAGALRPEESVAFAGVVRGEPVRVVAYAQPVFTASGEGPAVIEVAQTLHSRAHMIKQIWFTNLGQEALMLILVIPLVWVALRQGMRSTLRLRDTVQGRAAGTLEALDPAPVPAEIRPLVIAINDYVRDLEAQVAARSRFIANASHQLRTPLTVLQTQVSFGLKTADPAQKEEVMKAILSGIQVATRLVNQLLSLSAAESSGRQHGRAEVDLGGLAKHVLEEYASLAQAKEIDLGLERKRAEPILVNASPLMLHEMVSNLVDNALRYTPAGGVVTVAVEWTDGFPVLRIEDNGPGIPPAERERVFERFYRLQEMDSLGCGLGLAIVREVASAMDATVILAAPPSGTGLVVTVGFPPAGPACREDARS